MSGWDPSENGNFSLRFLSSAPEEDGWVTCQDEDPTPGWSNQYRKEVKITILIGLA